MGYLYDCFIEINKTIITFYLIFGALFILFIAGDNSTGFEFDFICALAIAWFGMWKLGKFDNQIGVNRLMLVMILSLFCAIGFYVEI
jgi:hypothetical protein